MSRAEAETTDVAVGARWRLLALIAGGVFALDQLTKWWAMTVLPGEIIHVAWTLQFQLTLNTGSAFSIAQGRGPLISLLALAVVAVLLRTGRSATRPATAVAVGLVVGGAFGNLADRAFRAGEGFLGGGVVDFIDLQWWPVFNVADMAVVCGALLLLVASWREEAERERKARAAQAAAGGDEAPASRPSGAHPESM